MKKRKLNFKLKDQENIDQLNNESILTAESVNNLIDIIFPIGSVIAYSAEIINNPHFMICNGDEISRSKYNKLFTLIGITYGEGDGETTFNLPNLTGKFLEGALNNFGQYINPGLPNITGGLEKMNNNTSAPYWNTKSGAFYSKNIGQQYYWSTPNNTNNDQIFNIFFDASLCSPIYGASTTVQPPALTMNYIIRVI